MSGTVTVREPPAPPSVVRVPLAIAYRPCPAGAADRVHGAPLGHPACAPVQVSDWLTVGTWDANRRHVRSSGFVRAASRPGDPATPADDADVALSASVSDVRSRASLSDYTGELEAVLPLRITDDANGPAQSERATGDTTFAFSVPCTPTADPEAGSRCDVTTTADAVAPGAVVEGKRTTWEIGAVQVYDGGADGLAATAGNTLFADQSVFVP
jgi:hypothetical protein